MCTAVGIHVFDEVEVLDFAGPYEVFTTASRVHQRDHSGLPEPFRVFTVARKATAIRARAGLAVVPDYAIDRHPAIDLLLVPGGLVTAPLEDRVVIEWVGSTAARAKLVASVCTGAFLLAKAGLLNGKSATTNLDFDWKGYPVCETP